MTQPAVLQESELFSGLSPEQCARLAGIAHWRGMRKGEPLFRLGDAADALMVIAAGAVELSFPLRILGELKEVRFHSFAPGSALAWSALVPPHRLTMSAWAQQDGKLQCFARGDILPLFAADVGLGLAVMSNLSRIIAARLHETQALWVREMQRHVSETYR